MKTHLSYFFILALGALAGCTQSSIVIGGDDAGPDVRSDSGGVRCGPATCAEGLVCCNESCGTCTAPGGTCTTLACAPLTCDGVACESASATCCPGCRGESLCSGPGGECPAIDCAPTCDDLVCEGGDTCCTDCDGNGFCSAGGCPAAPCPPPGSCGGAVCEEGELCCDACGIRSCSSGGTCPDVDCDPCAPMDARTGDAACALLLGYAWTGTSCEAILCTCTGEHCGSIYRTEGECEAEHMSCRGCSDDADCNDEEWCHLCAHGSCPVCDDCVPDCAPHGCETHPVLCDAIRPECGEHGVAIGGESGCWECVDRITCEPLPLDCRTTGCEAGATCEECPSAGGSAWSCVPAGAAC